MIFWKCHRSKILKASNSDSNSEAGSGTPMNVMCFLGTHIERVVDWWGRRWNGKEIEKQSEHDRLERHWRSSWRKRWDEFCCSWRSKNRWVFVSWICYTRRVFIFKGEKKQREMLTWKRLEVKPLVCLEGLMLLSRGFDVIDPRHNLI